MSTVVDVQHVTKTFSVAGGSLTVLDDVCFALTRSEQVAIVGASGSGKSTLLGLLAGLDQPTRGNVIIDGQDLAHLSPGRLADLRGRRMGFVFQSFRLLPTLSALENVAVPLELTGQAHARQTAGEWLERVGLSARADHLPTRLSGGEQQRVALARALAPRPAVLFADEPTGNLDSQTGSAMAELLFGMASKLGTTLVLVTHDADLAARAQRCITLADGRIQSDQPSSVTSER